MNLSNTDIEREKEQDCNLTVTDVIGIEYKAWSTNKIVFIEAGTGKGKSTFIKKTLYQYCKDNHKKILLFSNRANLLTQNNGELIDDFKLDDGVITLYNYQKLDYQDSHILSKETIHLSNYDYVVCDECHYFFTDATFNKFTDISLGSILKCNAIKVFMSATPQIVKKYIQEKVGRDNIVHYFENLKNNYSYINQLYFYHNPKAIENNLLDNLKFDEKVLYFNKSANECYRLHQKYKDNSTFVVSQSNHLYKYVNKTELNNITNSKYQRFDSQILFATTCLDNGINLVDEKIKHIVIDIRDFDTIIQCLGRKRIQNANDAVNVYIRNINNKQLGGIVTGSRNKLEEAEQIQKIGVNKWLMNKPRQSIDARIIYIDIDGEVRINEIAYTKYKYDMYLSDILLRLSKNSKDKMERKYPFATALSIKLQHKNFKIYDAHFKVCEFKQYLDNIVGKRLFKDEQAQLKVMFNRAGLVVKNGRGMGLKTMNGFLQDFDLPYKVISKKIKL